MDIVSSASAVVGLVFSFTVVIKACNDVRGRFQAAARTVESIRHELEVLKAALQELANLMMHDASALASRWDSSKTLPLTFKHALAGFQKLIVSLQNDFEPLRRSDPSMKRMDKIKLLWNEDSMKEHLGQLRAQSSALNLLLQVFQTGSMSDMKNDLQSIETALAQLSSATNSNSAVVPQPSRQNEDQIHILDDQGDLMEFDLLEEAQQWSIPQRSVHLEILERSFASWTSSDPEVKIAANSRTSNPPEAPKSVKELQPPMQPSEQEVMSSSSRSSDEEQNSVSISSSSPPLDGPGQHPEPRIPRSPADSFQRCGKPAKIDSSDSSLQLSGSVTKGDLAQVAKLLDAGCDIESRHPLNGRTGLVLAAYFGHVDILEFLLGRGADAKAQDRDGRTALHYAVSEGSLASVELLLTEDTVIKYKDCMSETPLHRASRYGRADIFKLLLSRFPKSLKILSRHKRNALHIATLYRHREVVEVICNHLREHLANHHTSQDEVGSVGEACKCPEFYTIVQVQESYGFTPLQIAIGFPDIDIASVLLRCSRGGLDEPLPLKRANKINPGIEDRLLWERPIHRAVEINAIALLRFVVEAGADYNLPNSTGQTALFLAVHQGSKKATKFLLRQGANFEEKCSCHDNIPLLSEAIELLSSAALDCLDLSSPQNDMAVPRGKLILAEATTCNRWDLVQILVGKTSQATKVGKTLDEVEALRHAIVQDREAALIEWLLQSGADPSVRILDELGWLLPIHLAGIRGKTEISRALLNHRANILSQDSLGWFAYTWAIARGDDADIIRWFFDETMKHVPGPKSEDWKSFIMQEGVLAACQSGLVSNIKLVVQLCDEDTRECVPVFLDKYLLRTVRCGMKEATEYLLSLARSSIPLSRCLKDIEKALENKRAKDFFRAKDIDDSIACRKLVEHARDKFEGAGQAEQLPSSQKEAPQPQQTLSRKPLPRSMSRGPTTLPSSQKEVSQLQPIPPKFNSKKKGRGFLS